MAPKIGEIEGWVKRHSRVVDDLLGPWHERHGFAWEYTAGFFSWAIERRFGIPRSSNNALEIFEHAFEGKPMHPTFNLVTVNGQRWLLAVGLVETHEQIARPPVVVLPAEILNGTPLSTRDIVPWRPHSNAKSQSGDGEEFWNDIVAAARSHAYCHGRPMVHGLWTVQVCNGERFARIVPHELKIREREREYPDYLSRMM